MIQFLFNIRDIYKLILFNIISILLYSFPPGGPMNKYFKQYKWSNIFAMLRNQKKNPNYVQLISKIV